MSLDKQDFSYLYEVNLTIEKKIFEINKEWLIEHFHEMVRDNKFIKLNLFFVKNMNPIDDNDLRYQSLVAQYYVPNIENLLSYFERFSKNTRSQVSEKLGCNYNVTRRVLEIIDIYEP